MLDEADQGLGIADKRPLRVGAEDDSSVRPDRQLAQLSIVSVV